MVRNPATTSVSDLLKFLANVLGIVQIERASIREGRLDAELEKRIVECLIEEKWKRRTFRVIRRKVRIGTDEELRTHLHRIGAIPSGTPGDGEFWELPVSEKKNLDHESNMREGQFKIGFAHILIVVTIFSALFLLLNFSSTWTELDLEQEKAGRGGISNISVYDPEKPTGSIRV